MQARARLIREAQEAREKRRDENGAKAQAALLATIEAERNEADGSCKICNGPAAIGARVCLKCSVKIAFPGGIDDMEI